MLRHLCLKRHLSQVLLSQSHPFVASFKVSTQWWLVIAGQVVSVISSITSIIWPMFIGITVSRAAHGIAEAVYMIYALVLLVELTPRRYLALGIACLTAGMTAGDSLGPVLGAIMYDATGIRGAFSLQAATNTMSMVLTISIIPMWMFAPQQSRDQLLKAQATARSLLPVHQTQVLHRSGEPEECANNNTEGRTRQKSTEPLEEIKRTRKQLEDSLLQKQILNIVSTLKVPVICREHLVFHLCDDICKGPNSSTAARTVTAPASDATKQTLVPESSAVFCDEPTMQCECADFELCIETEQLDTVDSHTSTFAIDQNKAKIIQQPVTKQLDTRISCSSIAGTTCSECASSSSSSSSSSDELGSLPAGKLHLAAVVDTLKDPIIFSQCVLLLLEQTIRSTLSVVLSAAMGTRQLVVGMVYIANVAGSVTSPFLIDVYMARKNTKCSTHMLAAGISIIMGLSCAAVVPLSKTIAALVILLIIAGSTQAAIEALVYVYVAKRLDSVGKHTATHVAMCMYILAQTAGGCLGSLVGSALLLQSWELQIIVAGVVCIVAGLYGTVLSVVTHRRSAHYGDAVIQVQ